MGSLELPVMKTPAVKVSVGGSMTARVLLNGQAGKFPNSASQNHTDYSLHFSILEFCPSVPTS